MTDPRTMTTSELVAAVTEADAAAFAAPWVAHTFEIDCPCPNGVHCGDSHTCEEVDAPEVYPHSHESPAEKGDGQCVVQIDVPGLETFAKPNAALIALYRSAAPELARRLVDAESQRDAAIARAERAEAALTEIAAHHKIRRTKADADRYVLVAMNALAATATTEKEPGT